MMYGGYSQQPQTNVFQVSGEQEVRSFQYAPNSTFAFFDRNEQVIYYVRTDASGRVNIDYLDFTIRPDPEKLRQENEIDELKKRLMALESMLGGKQNEPVVSESAGSTPAV